MSRHLFFVAKAREIRTKDEFSDWFGSMLEVELLKEIGDWLLTRCWCLFQCIHEKWQETGGNHSPTLHERVGVQ